MYGSYDVFCAEQAVGRVRLDRQGLYVSINCRCSPADGRKYSLYAETDTGICPLGLLYPVDGVFGMDTRIPLKKMGQGSLRFFLREKNEQAGLVSLDTSLSCSVMLHLEQYRFARIDGKPCLILHHEKIG